MKQSFRSLFSRNTDSALTILIALAVLKLVIHLLTSSTYGYFRDEFYYIAASKHLAFGYVDFPPFIALLTAFVRLTLGDSLLALHFFPALAGAGVVLLTGLMARQLGADPFGQVLAAIAALVAPHYLGVNALLTMDSFDLLVWAVALYVLILILKYDRPKLWLVFGLVLGIGLTIKVTPLYFGLALVVGLALTPYRKYFRNPYLYLGGLIALAFLLPYVIWNAVQWLANDRVLAQLWEQGIPGLRTGVFAPTDCYHAPAQSAIVVEWPGFPVHAKGKRIPSVWLDVSGFIPDLHAPTRQELFPGTLLSGPVRRGNDRHAAVRQCPRLALAGMATPQLHSFPCDRRNPACTTDHPHAAIEHPGGICARTGWHECKIRKFRYRYSPAEFRRPVRLGRVGCHHVRCLSFVIG